MQRSLEEEEEEEEQVGEEEEEQSGMVSASRSQGGFEGDFDGSVSMAEEGESSMMEGETMDMTGD
jgi:hypothetical protein